VSVQLREMSKETVLANFEIYCLVISLDTSAKTRIPLANIQINRSPSRDSKHRLPDHEAVFRYTLKDSDDVIQV
jgi:hypothetical protein